MPANLPAEAKHKWREASETRRPEEKIEKLQEFLSLVPKHKGTENLRAQVKRKIAILRKEIAEKKRKKAGVGGPKFFVEKEGDAQIVILGPTNVGRSSLLSLLTNAKVEISNYLYTTKEPTPGMFQHQDLQLQIVEAPALMEGSADRGTWGLQTLTAARNADGLLLMIDLSQDPVEQFSLISRELDKARILTRKPKARVEIERKYMGAGLKIIILGHLVDCTSKDVEQLLKSYGIRDAAVKIQGEATIDDVEDAVFEGTVYRPAVIIANKADIPNATERIEQLKGLVGEEMKILPVSCEAKFGLDKLGSEIFEMLDIIRVYTKEPNDRFPSEKPFTVRKGSTVFDLARRIHSDFYKQFSYAKVWSKRLRFSPQKVGGTFTLEDGDTVEIHMK
ncbi:MAG: TGS domain-containing protein [Candidatus Bathyarchaeota archaeon]|nr:TGS domain-containing protein [Candidatus Bathyarchaeota archaeon]MDH5635750.1 TGS domain-containing protein [Candidatus Bathyarchaeota archaeon]MDH5702090.1 TGS domain-containing protein [Candidatus Bathyarchaeota archaeon]